MLIRPRAQFRDLSSSGLSDTVTVENLAALKALTSRPESVVVKSGHAAGVWQWVAGSSSTADDGLIVTCTSGAAGRYKRVYSGLINVNWYPVTADGIADDSTYVEAALAAGGITFEYSPARTFGVGDIDVPAGRTIDLGGSGVVAVTGASYCFKMTGYGSAIRNGGMSDGNRYTVRSTTLSAPELSGQTTLSMTSVTGFAVNNMVFIECDGAQGHATRITAVGASTIDIADALPANAASGNSVETCRGVLILDEARFTSVTSVIFSNQPMAIELRSIGGATGTGKNVISGCFIDYTQLAAMALIGDVFDNQIVAVESWSGTTANIPKVVGYYLDNRPGTLLISGGNSFVSCSSLGGDYGAILQGTNYSFWTACNLDDNAYWGLVLDNGANKNQFANLWASSNGLSGGGGVKSLGTNTIENLFNGLHGRFNGPLTVGPDINIAAASTMYVDENMFQENRVITGAGDVYFHPSQSLFENGTALLPSVSFRSDVNTGIYRVSADVLGAATAGVARQEWDATGNVSVGGGALATTATDGFLYVPTCAGIPTGAPTAKAGFAPIIVNTTNHKLYFYSGGSWRDAGP